MGAESLSSRAIIGRFYAALAAATGAGWVDPLSMLFTSDQASEEYRWLGMSPPMREWIGGRSAKTLRDQGITIKNLDFEATLDVLVKDLRRDKTGQLMVRINELAARAQSHWASLLSTLILNGPSTVCYDGQFFFDTDHSEGDSGSQSNDITADISTYPVSVTGTTTNPSTEELEYSILDGIEAILGFKDDQGEPMNEGATNFIVMVPTVLWNNTLAATRNPVIGGGRTNTLVQSAYVVTPVMNPRLTWTDSFAVFRADGQVKPFIRQEEQGVKVNAKAEGSEYEFDTNRHAYGIDASRNVGYGYWQHACYVTMT